MGWSEALLQALFREMTILSFLEMLHDINFWNLGGLSFVFPTSLSQKIKATPIPMVASGVDRISRASSPNGEFDLKEAYNLACETHDTLQGESFKGNWV